MGLTNKDIALVEALRGAITDAVEEHDFEEAVRDQIEKFDLDDKIERAVDDLDLDNRIEKWMDSELEGTLQKFDWAQVEDQVLKLVQPMVADMVNGGSTPPWQARQIDLDALCDRMGNHTDRLVTLEAQAQRTAQRLDEAVCGPVLDDLDHRVAMRFDAWAQTARDTANTLDALRKRVEALTVLVASRPTDAIRPEDAPSPLRMRLAQPQPIRLVFVEGAPRVTGRGPADAWECLDCGRRYHERRFNSDDEGLPAVCAEDCPGLYRTLR